MLLCPKWKMTKSINYANLVVTVLSCRLTKPSREKQNENKYMLDRGFTSPQTTPRSMSSKAEIGLLGSLPVMNGGNGTYSYAKNSTLQVLLQRVGFIIYTFIINGMFMLSLAEL